MLTLGILDLVGDDDLTGGAVVAGTGTIDRGRQRRADRRDPAEDGRRRATSTPISSWSRPTTARRRSAAADPGFPLARVATLDDALDALADFEAGRTPEPC